MSRPMNTRIDPEVWLGLAMGVPLGLMIVGVALLMTWIADVAAHS